METQEPVAGHFAFSDCEGRTGLPMRSRPHDGQQRSAVCYAGARRARRSARGLKGYPIGILHDQERFHVSHPPFGHGSSPGIVRFSDSSVVALAILMITMSDLRLAEVISDGYAVSSDG
jgi:hypothetical protein